MTDECVRDGLQYGKFTLLLFHLLATCRPDSYESTGWLNKGLGLLLVAEPVDQTVKPVKKYMNI